MIDGAVSMAFGEKARMLEPEREMIAEPLARIMMRLDPVVNEALQKWTDPLMLSFGLLMWGARIANMDREDNDKRGGRGKEPAPDIQPGGRTVEEVVEERGTLPAEDGTATAGISADLMARVADPGQIIP